MRLLTRKLDPNTDSLKLVLEEHVGDSIPSYTILSHRWGPDSEEVTFKDFDTSNPSLQSKRGFQKIVKSYQQAVEDGYSYLWVDTCCIDKSSSAELSEGINSMYSWYKDAGVCYAYLEDVDSDEDLAAEGSSFRRSVWFTRGWTLQELIAPKTAVFIARDWTEIGTKTSLAGVISEITNIDTDVLLHNEHDNISIAKRMSWAANRKTARVEDSAYSLLGLFGVNIPAIYGEGSRAFARLQHEILKVSTDHSIFAWQNPLSFPGRRTMLAESPDQFAESKDFDVMRKSLYAQRFGIKDYEPNYAMTNLGLQIQLPLLRIHSNDTLKNLNINTIGGFNPRRLTFLAFIACTLDEKTHPPYATICIVLEKLRGPPHNFYIRRYLQTVATFQARPDIEAYKFEIEQIVIHNKDPSVFEHFNYFAIDDRKHQFLLEDSGCGTFEVIEKSHDAAWRDVEAGEICVNRRGVVYRCSETSEEFVAIVGFLEDKVWCEIARSDRTETPKSLLESVEASFFALPSSFLDWVTIPRERKPRSRIVMTVRRTKSVKENDYTYLVKITERESGGVDLN